MIPSFHYTLRYSSHPFSLKDHSKEQLESISTLKVGTIPLFDRKLNSQSDYHLQSP